MRERHAVVPHEDDGRLLEDERVDAGQEARELNIGFVSRMTRGRPWVRLKIAATLDGRTALENGVSQWITGPEARRDGVFLRQDLSRGPCRR